MSDEFGYEYDSEGWPSGDEGNAEEEDEGKIMIENTFHEAEGTPTRQPFVFPDETHLLSLYALRQQEK